MDEAEKKARGAVAGGAYDAFISYRRSDGTRAAQWLRGALQGYRLPADLAEGRHELKVYLDSVYERANDDFWSGTIVPALDASRYLIVVSTPDAREPQADGTPNWVAREIEHFSGRADKGAILVVLAAGNYGDALPTALEERLPNIQVTDIRGAHSPRARWSRRDALRQSLRTLVAELHDIDDSDMPLLREEEASRRRRRWMIAVGLTVAVLTVILFLAVRWYFQVLSTVLAEEERRLAVQQAELATEQAEVARGRFRLERERADQEAERRRRTKYFAQINLADEARRQSLLPRMRDLLAATEERYRGWEWYRLDYLAHRGVRPTTSFQWTEAVAVSPDGEWLAAAGHNGRTNLVAWRSAAPEKILDLDAGQRRADSLFFTLEGNRLVMTTIGPSIPVGGFEYESVYVFELPETEPLLALTKPSDGRWSIILGPESSHAVTHSRDESGRLEVWDLQSGTRVGEQSFDREIYKVFTGANSDRLLVAFSKPPDDWGVGSMMQLWRRSPLEPMSGILPIEAESLAGTDPRLFEVIGTDEAGAVRAWKTSTGESRVIDEGPVRIKQMVCKPRALCALGVGQALGTPQWDQREWVLVFGPGLRMPLKLPRDFGDIAYGHASINGAMLEGLAFSPNGRFLVVPRGPSSAEKVTPTLRVFDMRSGRQTVAATGDANTGWPLRSAFLPGELLAASNARNEIDVIDLTSGAVVTSLLGHDTGSENWLNDLRTSADGSIVVSSDRSARIVQWRLEEERNEAVAFSSEVSISELFWGDAGKRLVIGGRGPETVDGQAVPHGLVQVWNTGDERPERVFAVHNFGVQAISRVPGSSVLAAIDGFDGASLWDYRTGEKVHDLVPGRKLVQPVSLPQDRYHGQFPTYYHQFQDVDCSTTQCAAAALRDGTIRVWETASPAERGLWRPFERALVLKFSADGRYLAAGGGGQLALTDAADLEALWTTDTGSIAVTSIAMDSRARRLAAGLQDGRILFLDAGNGELLFELKAHLGAVTDLDFEPLAGDRFVSASDDSSVKIWDSELGLEVLDLRGHDGGVAAVAFHPSGRSLASGGRDGSVLLWGSSLPFMR